MESLVLEKCVIDQIHLDMSEAKTGIQRDIFLNSYKIPRRSNIGINS